jgi:peptidoglycan/xylan/chitin deacetylase (PgdA/CDA1 family)
MRYLHQHGYVCLLLTDLFRHPDNGRSRRRKTFAPTFDDSREDFFTLAYPILRDYGFTATVFVVTNWTCGQSDLEREGKGQHLTWEQIEALQQSGISFGSYTCTHSRLPGLSHEEIQHELTASKECLEARLDEEIQYLAYPHSESTCEIQKMAEGAGYTAAFCGSHGRSSRFNMWRRACRRNDTLLTFVLRLNRWYHYPEYIREETAVGRFFHKIKRRIYF